MQAVGLVYRLNSIRCFADHVPARTRFQQSPEAVPNNRVIIDQ
jgi:hypothetical protein